MVVFFEEKDLVSFGNYLLSDFRRESFERHREESEDKDNYVDTSNEVNHADLENWAYLEQTKEEY